MSNTTLSTKLASFINGQMTGFLNQVSEKHGIDATILLSEWEAYTGLKPKTKKSVVKGPTIKELREKLKAVNLPTSGKKQDLIDRLDDFDAGKIKPKVLDTASAIAAGDYSVMNVKMLKDKLKEKGLKSSGSKADLVKRLTESGTESDTDNEGDEEALSPVSACFLAHSGLIPTDTTVAFFIVFFFTCFLIVSSSSSSISLRQALQ